MPAETLTFEKYRLDLDAAGAIYSIGADETHEGVIPEMATAFGHELSETPEVDNLGDLISKVGPAKELQENIAGVQEVLGTNEDAVTIARGWAERSGLLVPVERSYYSAEQTDQRISLAVMTGGVRNWMARRAQRLAELSETRGIERALLVAGNRLMKPTEGPDVGVGMTEADYMRTVVANQLRALGLSTTVVSVESSIGDQVMEEGARKAEELIRLSFERMAVVSNAGAWVQNVGQFRRAVIRTYGKSFDITGDQVLAVSDGFPLGTGTEPTSTHQNPLSAAGQIVRNAQELARNLR